MYYVIIHFQIVYVIHIYEADLGGERVVCMCQIEREGKGRSLEGDMCIHRAAAAAPSQQTPVGS